MSSAYQIYTGRWHNYSDSSGGQVTLSVFYGGLLLAGVATFVAIVGGQFWLITTFIVHQRHERRGAHDAMHNLHQATLRNSGTPLGAAWSLIKSCFVYSGRKSWWNWTRQADPYVDSPKLRTASLTAIAALVWVVFTAAGPATSLLTHRPYQVNEVKVVSDECGSEQWGSDAISDGAFKRYNIRSALDALTYVNACYNTTSSTACSTQPRQSLLYDAVTGISCPFGQRCKTPAIELTTHWLDSHNDFGINAPPQNRLQLRKQVTCAVLNTTDVTRIVPIGANLSSHEYYFGPVPGISPFTTYALERQPFDYAGYSVLPYYAFAGVPNQPWTPIDDLSITDGDISLFAVQFGAITYDTPVGDPLFSANNMTESGNYSPDDIVGLVACIDRYQLKTPDGTVTTDLAGVDQVSVQFQKLPFNRAQLATATRFMYPGYSSEMYNAVFGLGVAALRAQRNVLDLISTGLPDNQWELEVRGWFEVTLAMHQLKTVSYAYKPNIRSEKSVTLRTNLTISNGMNLTEELRAMCDEQKLRNVAQYQTFSQTGLIVIAVVGLVIIVVSLAQEILWDVSWKGWMWFRGFWSAPPSTANWRLLQWKMDSVPHLQRLAYQNAKEGRWERCRDDIPVTKGRLKMPDLGNDEGGYLAVPDDEH